MEAVMISILGLIIVLGAVASCHYQELAPWVGRSIVDWHIKRERAAIDAKMTDVMLQARSIDRVTHQRIQHAVRESTLGPRSTSL